jgi:hypothetical protein
LATGFDGGVCCAATVPPPSATASAQSRKRAVHSAHETLLKYLMELIALQQLQRNCFVPVIELS